MELYFKDLISNDASLEKLVEDLTLGADDFANSLQSDVAGHVDRFKESCRRLKENAVAGAQATDKLLRQNPYAGLGIAALAGLLIGIRLTSGRRRCAG